MGQRRLTHTLMRASSGAVLALALSYSTAARADYCRTTTCPEIVYPAGDQFYPGPCPDGQTTPVCAAPFLPVAWPTACVSYSLDITNVEPADQVAIAALIGRAFDAWTDRHCSSPNGNVRPSISVRADEPILCGHVEYNPDQANSNAIIVRRTWPYKNPDDGNPSDDLALTTVTFSVETGELYDADMELNLSDLFVSRLDDGSDIPDERSPAPKVDMLAVLTHEAGHFLGLAHHQVSNKPDARGADVTMPACNAAWDSFDSVMRTQLDYGPRSACYRTPKQDDRTAVCEIYSPLAPRECLSYEPRNGRAQECALNPAAGGWCATGAAGAPRGGSSALLVLAGASALVAARRASARRAR